MSISFSNPIKFSGEATFSPNHKSFAITRGLDLRIYDAASQRLINKYTFCDYIEKIQWSQDSNLIMICLFKRGIVEVKQMKKPDWICKVTEGVAGIAHAFFSPDSRNIMTVCNNNIKLTVWSLTTKTTIRISLPKFAKKGISFTSKGNFMALALRTSPKDSIGIYYLGNWTQINKFDVISNDLQDIKWTYDNSSILIWDNPMVCKLYVYSPVGDLLEQIEPYQLKLGIKSCQLSPNGRIISLGCYDQSVRLYNNVSYTLITALDHSQCELNLDKVNYFVEERIDINQTKYVTAKPPVALQSTMPKSSDIFPKMGIKRIEFSFDSNFMATKNDNMKNVVFIWELFELNLFTVIVQLNNVVDFKWSPKQNVLFIVTDNNKLYHYNLEAIFVTDLPDNFRANEIVLNSIGSKIILKDPDYMILVDYQSENILDDDELKKSSSIKDKSKSEHIDSGMDSKNSLIDDNHQEQDNNIEQNDEEEYYNEDDINNLPDSNDIQNISNNEGH